MLDIVRSYREALPISIVAHLVLVGLMIVGVRIGSSSLTPDDPGSQPMQATAVDEKEVEAAVKRLQQQASAEERAAIRKQKELEQQLAKLKRQREQETQEVQQKQSQSKEVSQQLQKLQAEREQLAQEREQLRNARASESEQLEKLEQQRREAAEAREQARKEAAAERTKAEQARKEAEQARREAELARKAREEAEARAEAERKAREAAEKAAAEKAKQERLAGLRGTWVGQIKDLVSRNWRPPADYQEQGQNAEVLVTLVPGGDVTGVKLQSCKGTAAFCASVEAAVERSSPLPAAPDPDVFQRQIQFIFKPEAG